QGLLLEVEADGLRVQDGGVDRVGGQGEDAVELLGAQVVDLAQVAGAHARAFSRRPTASSSSSSVIRRDGARRSAVGVTALATAPSWSSRGATALASWPSSSTARRRPRPRTPATPGTSASRARSAAP